MTAPGPYAWKTNARRIKANMDIFCYDPKVPTTTVVFCTDAVWTSVFFFKTDNPTMNQS